jgi:hypothetical protein
LADSFVYPPDYKWIKDGLEYDENGEIKISDDYEKYPKDY